MLEKSKVNTLRPAKKVFLHKLCYFMVINFFVGLLFLRLLEQLGPQLLYSIFASICRMEEFGNKVTKLQQTLARNQTPARNNKNATAKQVPVIIITLPLFSSSSW
ncbi:hypothetical protein ES319_A06G087800v1 [Gossypium barbadense]|uniref:Uncharacterized protein n=2 Tax=Gossypium TaxID=3633 RepID=A0A5J5VC32_GOSBA|nr:hypothetical protein ES319_A06G087800v1 [Gossypium barbadense]TYH12844.1 hypothetical protein ES288_A06G097900v1 [Gossypium darwinii]